MGVCNFNFCGNVCSFSYLESIEVFKLTDGTTISLEIGGLAQIVLIIAVYYISKFILFGRDEDQPTTKSLRGEHEYPWHEYKVKRDRKTIELIDEGKLSSAFYKSFKKK